MGKGTSGQVMKEFLIKAISFDLNFKNAEVHEVGGIDEGKDTSFSQIGLVEGKVVEVGEDLCRGGDDVSNTFWPNVGPTSQDELLEIGKAIRLGK